MKMKTIITFKVVLVVIFMAIFNSGCGLIDTFAAALGRYCAMPEFIVTRTDDPTRGGLCTADSCSLRQAVQTSNSCPGIQTIRIPAGTYLLSLPGSDEEANRSGDLDIIDSVIILGQDGTIIAGGRIDRVFDVFSAANVTLKSLILTNGSGVDGGGIRNAGTLTMQGGAIQMNLGRRGAGLFNSGAAELESVRVQDNEAERGFGGGIYNEGSLRLTNSSLLRNTGSIGVSGGGLFNAGTAILDSVNVEGNTVDLQGGGIHNTGSLAMTGGFVQKNNAGTGGGGLYNSADGVLTLSGVTIAENMLGVLIGSFGVPVSEGAGLANAGEATLQGCLLIRNQAGHSRGGGIINDGTLTVRNSTLELNSALQGAGLFNYGSANIDGSTIDANTVAGFSFLAGIGGGIFNTYQANLILTNSTLSGNVAIVSDGAYPLYGAGLYNEGVAELSSVTLTGNNPDGLYSGLPGIEGEPVGPPAVKLKNTLIAGNTIADCSGATILSLGNNLDGDDTCGLTNPSDLSGRDPQLGPLASNGGSTQTHALLSDSPAIDQGGSCMATDQRGYPRPRPVGGACDIGAYEVDSANVNIPQPTATPAATAAAAVPSILTFTQPANCRQGPSTQYAPLGYGQIGGQAQILGISAPAGWYYVLLPDGKTRCFVAGTTGTTTGPLDGLSVIPAPQLPTPTLTLPVVPSVTASPMPVPLAAPELNVSNKACDYQKYVVHLSWKDVNGEDGYRVYRDGTLIATLGADVSTYDDVSPDFNSHSYQVQSFNNSGSANSSTENSEGCLF